MSKSKTNVFVIEVDLKEKDKPTRSAEARLQEAVSLTSAIDLFVVGQQIVALKQIRPASYIGSGKVEELRDVLAQAKADLVLMDCALSPIQQRNLEKEWKLKVIDRTALILEIFGERAHTKEGVLQVELAHLTYQRSRLVRSWTHLERQRGGAGFLGGPGETQIEMDRRILDDKIVQIKKDLEKVKKTRSLQRESRQKVPFPVVSLVGYTNAGKSTLFNYLTKADVFAKDLLFATLDPTMRQLELPSGKKIILSDTVGFISELPTELVAAFRATLEEVLSADLILHVRDCSHPDTQAQKQDVEAVLKDLGLQDQVATGLPEVMNKIDLLPQVERQALLSRTAYRAHIFPICAKTGQGIDKLLHFIDQELARKATSYLLRLPFDDGKMLGWLYEKGAIVSSKQTDDCLELIVNLSKKDCALVGEKYALYKRS